MLGASRKRKRGAYVAPGSGTWKHLTLAQTEHAAHERLAQVKAQCAQQLKAAEDRYEGKLRRLQRHTDALQAECDKAVATNHELLADNEKLREELQAARNATRNAEDAATAATERADCAGAICWSTCQRCSVLMPESRDFTAMSIHMRIPYGSQSCLQTILTQEDLLLCQCLQFTSQCLTFAEKQLADGEDHTCELLTKTAALETLRTCSAAVVDKLLKRLESHDISLDDSVSRKMRHMVRLTPQAAGDHVE